MRIVSTIFLLNCASWAASYPNPVEGDHLIKGFKFATGESLPELKLHYTTIGSPWGDSNRAGFFGIETGATDSPEVQELSAKGEDKVVDPNQERLSKLNALLSKGLIDKSDYEARKAEILNPAPVKPITIEDRLKKLNELFKKGLIAQPEYDKKRAEILSEM